MHRPSTPLPNGCSFSLVTCNINITQEPQPVPQNVHESEEQISYSNKSKTKFSLKNSKSQIELSSPQKSKTYSHILENEYSVYNIWENHSSQNEHHELKNQRQKNDQNKNPENKEKENRSFQRFIEKQGLPKNSRTKISKNLLQNFEKNEDNYQAETNQKKSSLKISKTSNKKNESPKNPTPTYTSIECQTSFQNLPSPSSPSFPLQSISLEPTPWSTLPPRPPPFHKSSNLHTTTATNAFSSQISEFPKVTLQTGTHNPFPHNPPLPTTPSPFMKMSHEIETLSSNFNANQTNKEQYFCANKKTLKVSIAEPLLSENKALSSVSSPSVFEHVGKGGQNNVENNRVSMQVGDNRISMKVGDNRVSMIESSPLSLIPFPATPHNIRSSFQHPLCQNMRKYNENCDGNNHHGYENIVFLDKNLQNEGNFPKIIENAFQNPSQNAYPFSPQRQSRRISKNLFNKFNKFNTLKELNCKSVEESLGERTSENHLSILVGDEDCEWNDCDSQEKRFEKVLRLMTQKNLPLQREF